MVTVSAARFEWRICWAPLVTRYSNTGAPLAVAAVQETVPEASRSTLVGAPFMVGTVEGVSGADVAPYSVVPAPLVARMRTV